jgi:aryl-alcohol dehydrogenase-like predicted oxidoreductase
MGDPLDARAVIGGGGFGGIGSPRELIGHGTDAIGTSAVLDRCLDLRVTVIDTAYSYAGGASQLFIGRWLAADPTRRSRVAIVDKVGIVEARDGVATDLSPATVKRCAEEGRARMGVAAVDVVMAHEPDPRTPVRSTLGAFARLVAEGHARHWGISNVDADDLRGWLDEAERLGVPGPFVVENELSLLARDDEQEVLPLCRAHGIRYYAFSPLAGGVLTGKYRRGQEPPPGSRVALRPSTAATLDAEVLDRVDVLATRAASYGVSPAALALGWVLAQPGVSPIAGVSSPTQLHVLAEALALDLAAEEAVRLADDVGL